MTTFFGRPTPASARLALSALVALASLTAPSDSASQAAASPPQTTTYRYDANGQRISETNGANQTTGYTLDALKRITAITNALGATATRNYNGLNEVTSARDFSGVTTHYVRDAFGNITSESSPDTGTRTTKYDSLGLPIRRENALGQVTTIERDLLGRPTQLTFADGHSTMLRYDLAGSDYNGPGAPKASTGYLSEITDRSGTTRYQRDIMGRVLRKVHLLANGTRLTTGYSYNAQGLLDTLTYPGGGSLQHAYDATGLLTSLSWNRVPLITDIQWTPLGQPKSWTWTLEKPIPASRSFDTAGRMTQTEFSSYTYDAAGRITSLTQQLYKPTPAPQPPTVVSMTQVKETRINRTVSQYVYRVTVQNGPDAQTGVIATVATVGSGTTIVDGRVKVGDLAANASVTPTDTISLKRDRNLPFDPAAVTWRMAGQPAEAITQATVTWGVGYDAVGRIVSFGDGTNSASFTYDANGNRLTSTQTKAGETVSRSYSVQGNKLLGFSQSTAAGSGTAETSVAYTHNANGDLLSDGLRTYGYDAEGRLASATTGQSDEAPTTRYAHNALGQRVFKTDPLYPAIQGDESDPGFLTSLVEFFKRLWSPQTQSAEKLGWAYGYDEEGTLLAELGSGGASSTGSTKHIWLPTSTGPMPVAAIINGARFAVHADHLNTPRRLTNRQGQVVWQWGYSAFGDNKPTIAASRFADTETTANSGSTNVPAVVYNLRYPGQYFDLESGLAQNRFRFYDAKSGRYIQSDLIGLQGGWNRFEYVGGNPLSFTDPDGLQVRPRPAPGAPFPGSPSPRPVDPFEPGGPTYTPRPSTPNWLKGWLPKSAMERCEAQCDAKFDDDQKLCEAFWKMHGRSADAYRVCMSRARQDHIQCFQECKKDCQ